MKQHSLWLGRFQPPTIAHLATVKTILNEWKRLTIGIVHASSRPGGIDPKWEPFLRRTSEVSFSAGKNPFTPDEVSRMWTACLVEQRLKSRVAVIPLPQVAYQPDFNRKFPPSKFDFVEVRLVGSDTEFDRDRQVAFSHLVGRPVSYISPPFKLHNAEIRKLVRDERREWREFIPQGAYEIFVEIDGPRRIAGE